MRTIASVAIKALKQLDESLFAPEWDKKFYDIYFAWKNMRYSIGANMDSMNVWRDKVSGTIKSMISQYEHGKRDRWYWTDGYNMRIAVSVMGGFKDSKAWESEVHLGVSAGPNLTFPKG